MQMGNCANVFMKGSSNTKDISAGSNTSWWREPLFNIALFIKELTGLKQ